MFEFKRQRKTKPKGLLIIILLLIVFGVAAFFRLGPPSLSSVFFSYIASPVWSLRDSFVDSSDGVFALFFSKRDLLRENKELKENLVQARIRLLENSILRKENDDLKALLGQVDEESFVLAGVLARPYTTPYDTLIVDAGRDKAIGVGDRVIVEGTVLIGEVEEIFGNSSRIKLYSSPGVERNVYFSDSELEAPARGEGGGNFLVRIPQEVPIEKGEKVVDLGVESLMLGTVSNIENEPGDVFQTIRFRTPINLSSLRWVLIEQS